MYKTRLEIEGKQLMYKKIVTEKTEEKAKFRIARTSYHVTYILGMRLLCWLWRQLIIKQRYTSFISCKNVS